jgi:hypothetical protein
MPVAADAAKVDSVELAAPEILSFQDFISSSTYSTRPSEGSGGHEEVDKVPIL